MGVWSTGVLGNDSAEDWLDEFLIDPELEVIEEAISAVTSGNDYIEADEASACLAACEVLARINGHPPSQPVGTEELDEWIQENPQSVPEELLRLAIESIDKILGPNSELRELWEDEDQGEDWTAALIDLKQRVAASSSTG